MVVINGCKLLFVCMVVFVMKEVVFLMDGCIWKFTKACL